ncbi:hypothetical protein ACFC08_28425 [Streptomyces sp. NPDC056112]|uniref:hypothetical protein n=1 Tax=Streptomyces sp. NPDC056112 TaxID=3345715 RepID=UPI0035E1607A
MEALAEHRWVGVWEHGKRCPACGTTTTRHHDTRYGLGWWTEYKTASGWSWHDPSGNDGPPPCPPPPVEALCPWDDNARRYAGAKGDDQLDTAMRTWCERHECAVSECPEPGPYCPGRLAHEDGEEGFPGPCTGRENSCRCMCPACCGDTPDVWGAPVY